MCDTQAQTDTITTPLQLAWLPYAALAARRGRRCLYNDSYQSPTVSDTRRDRWIDTNTTGKRSLCREAEASPRDPAHGRGALCREEVGPLSVEMRLTA
jgi:hypothetical protein